MALLIAQRRSTLVAIALAAISYPFIVRGVIELMHPKKGWLLEFLSLFVGTEKLNWLSSRLCLPVYEFLTSSVWQNAALFYTLWVSLIFAAWCFTAIKVNRHATP